jgi:hypothetical protein
MKKVECWRWRYRDPQLGCIRCTTAALTEEEAATYPESERIDGTLSMREVDERPEESARQNLGAVPTWSFDAIPTDHAHPPRREA